MQRVHHHWRRALPVLLLALLAVAGVSLQTGVEIAKASTNPNFNVNPSTVTVPAGAGGVTFSVDLDAAGSTGVGGFILTLTYDPTKVTIPAGAAGCSVPVHGSSASDPTLVGTCDVSPAGFANKIVITGAVAVTPANPNGVQVDNYSVATIKFVQNGAATGSFPLTLAILAPPPSNQSSCIGTADPQPTCTTTSGTANVGGASGGLLGDINCSGAVTAIDVVLTQRASVGLSLSRPVDCTAPTDINCNGSTTALDVVNVQRISVALSPNGVPSGCNGTALQLSSSAESMAIHSWPSLVLSQVLRT